MKESKSYRWAELASGQDNYIVEYYCKEKPNTFNLQLRYWVDALMKFQNIYDGNYKVEELLLILNLLCSSLETLAGVNIKPTEYTPSLKNYIKKR